MSSIKRILLLLLVLVPIVLASELWLLDYFNPNQTETYDSQSWQKIIPKWCKHFSDGCNSCTRTTDDKAGCTLMFCEKYSRPKCLD